MDIYVGNLPYSATEEEISELFSAYGPVNRVKIITDRETGRSKGFGFVTLDDQSQLNAAIDAMNGYDFQGRTLKVNASEPRPPRGGGGSRGNGQSGGFRRERRQEDNRFDDDRPGFGKGGRGDKRRDYREKRRDNHKGGGDYGQW